MKASQTFYFQGFRDRRAEMMRQSGYEKCGCNPAPEVTDMHIFSEEENKSENPVRKLSTKLKSKQKHIDMNLLQTVIQK